MEEEKKKRGGARPNSGRPAKAEYSKRITFRASQDVADILAEQPNMTKFIEKAIREKYRRSLY